MNIINPIAPKQAEFVLPYQQDTPKKNRIAGAAQVLEAKGIPYTQNELGEIFEATSKQVRNAIHTTSERTKKRSALKAKNHLKLTERDLDRVCVFIDENEEEAKDLSWDELNQQFGFTCKWETLRKRLQQRGYGFFKSVSFKWIDEDLAEYRVRWCKIMLERYPQKED